MLSIAAVLSLAGFVAAQLPTSGVPTCVSSCASTKISEGYCSNEATFATAYARCLSDNCNAADAATGTQYTTQICAGASGSTASGSVSATPSAASSESSATPTTSAPAGGASGDATAYAAGAVSALQGAGLTTLASALTSAAPSGLLMQLMQGNHTVFAPTNEAFSALGSATNDANVVNALLSYHVLAGTVDPSSLQEGSKTIVRSSLKGLPYVNLPGNQSQVVVLTKSANGSLTVLEPTTNITSTGNATYQNLMLQVVPTALSIPGSLASVLTGTPEVSSLVSAVQGVSPQLVSLLGNITGVTIFAPVNSAFAAAASTLSSANASTIQAVLLNHIVNGTAVYSSLIEPGKNVISAGGQPLSFVANSSGTFVSSGGSTARIITSDVIIQNGVVHLIDGILLNTASDPNAASSAAVSASSVQATQTAVQTGAVNPAGASSAAGGGSSASGGANSGAAALEFPMAAFGFSAAAAVLAGVAGLVVLA